VTVLRPALAVALVLCGCHYRVPTEWLSPEVQPLWTEADLPELPPDAENGWVLFGQGIWEISHESPPAHLMKVVHRSFDPEYPEESTTKSPEISWMEALELREEIEDFLDAEANRAAVGLLSESLSLSRFADNEEVSLTASRSRSPLMHLLEVWRIAFLHALSRAAGGSWEEAAADAARMAQGGFDLVVSSRTTLIRAVSLIIVWLSLELAETLLEGWEAEDGARHGDPGAEAALAGLCATTEAIDTRDIDHFQPMISEYLVFADMLEHIMHKHKEPGSNVIFDRNDTLHLWNELFRALEPWARNPLGAKWPGIPCPTDSWGWWLYNPLGKKIVDSMWCHGVQVAIVPQISKGEARRRDIAATRSDLLDRCEQLGLLQK